MLDEKNTPLVSIALCIYNGERFLREQLDSLVNQTYSNIEIVAVDDRSTDYSISILNEYANKHPFLRVIQNEQNLGYTKNFEKAIKLCNGEYIALCDQDDIWDLNKIELQQKTIQDNLLVYHDSKFIDENGNDMNKKMSDVLELYSGANPEIFLLSNCVSGHACFFKRELVSEILPFNPDHFHDHWIAYVATNLGSIYCIPQCLVSYRQHTTASTDILNTRTKRDKSYHENRDVAKYKRELEWLKQCRSYGKNKDQDFVNRFTTLFEKRIDSFLSIEYALTMRKHYDFLFSNQKLRKGTKTGFIYRQIWGLRAKTFWAELTGKKSKSM